MVLIFMAAWALIWVVIAAVQKEPLTGSDYIGIASAILGMNAFVGYLWFLRNWQKLLIDSGLNVISCDKSFLIPKIYKTKIEAVKQVKFTVTAVNLKGGKKRQTKRRPGL